MFLAGTCFAYAKNGHRVLKNMFLTSGTHYIMLPIASLDLALHVKHEGLSCTHLPWSKSHSTQWDLPLSRNDYTVNYLKHFYSNK